MPVPDKDLAAQSPAESRRQSRRARELAHRRTDAIEGAAAVFAAKGFHEAQMAEIARAAELSLASLYAMFDGKEDLYLEVLRTATRRTRDTLTQAVSGIRDPGEALLALIDACFEVLDDQHDLAVMVLSTTRGRPEELRRQLGQETNLGLHQLMVRIATEAKNEGYLPGIDPAVLGRMIRASVYGAAVDLALHSPGASFASVAPAVRAIFARVLSRAGD